MVNIIPAPPDTRPPSTKRKAFIQGWRNMQNSYQRAIQAHADAKVERGKMQAARDAMAPIPSVDRGFVTPDEIKARRESAREQQQAQENLEAAIKREEDARKSVENIRQQLQTYATDNLLAPSAEKFPSQFAAASGVLSVLTAGAVSLAGAIARLVGFTDALKGIMLTGVAGVILGLMFHVPPLVVHYRDWRATETGAFDPTTSTKAVADVHHNKAMLRFQFVTFGGQILAWACVTAALVAVIVRA